MVGESSRRADDRRSLCAQSGRVYQCDANWVTFSARFEVVGSCDCGHDGEQGTDCDLSSSLREERKRSRREPLAGSDRSGYALGALLVRAGRGRSCRGAVRVAHARENVRVRLMPDMAFETPVVPGGAVDRDGGAPERPGEFHTWRGGSVPGPLVARVVMTTRTQKGR